MPSRDTFLPRPWPADTGAMGTLMRDTDWSSRPLGPVSTWPQSLRTTIDLMLPAHVQIVVFWGPEFIAFYNDLYAPSIGTKHPHALGQPGAEWWTELWDDLGPLLQNVRDTGETLSARDRPFRIERHGYLEDVYFDISYSAIRNETGDVGGVLCLVNETTERVRNAAQVQTLEQARQAEAERVELTLNAGAVVGAWVWSVPDDTFTADETFCRTFGVDPVALKVGVPLRDVTQPIHPDDLPHVHRLIADALASGGRYRAEYRIASQTGGWQWIEANGHVELDASGQPTRFPGVLINIDDRKRAERGQQAEKAARHRAEDALAETHHQFELAQAAANLGVFSLDVTTNVLTVSPEFCRLFGLPELPTLPAETLESLRHDVPGSAMSDIEGRRLGTSPVETEYCIRRADDGQIRWLARRAEFVRDASGRPGGMVGIVQDITPRKLAEATLRETRARFEVLAQAMPNQVWTATADGQLDWFNDRIHTYSGRNDSQLVGANWTDIVYPDDVPVASAAWQNALTGLTPYEVEFRLRRHDGTYRWHIARALPLHTEGHVRWIGTNTDIDDQKATQAEMARLNASLEERVAERAREVDRIWRLSTDLMLVAREDGIIQSVNPAWTTLLGWHPGELLGRPFVDFVHPDDRGATAQEREQLAQGRTTLRFENRYLHRDGTDRVISWQAVPEDGFVHAVGRDITPERTAAAALREAEDRLRQSQKMEAVGQLTGGIAHDFNNLLQGISGSLEVVRKRISQGRVAEVERFVAGAIGATHRAAALTHRLLAFSRRQPLDPKPVKANPLVSSMEDLFRRTLGEHIGLEMVLAGGLWTTLCDPNQLESALLNLAINARDAMPDGGKLVIETCNAHLDSVYAGVTRGLKPGQYVCIAVTDSGTGMSPEVVERAFDPFFTTKPIGQGTGLGLSMIYGFALQSEGFCKIYSEVGQGTTVKLYLPRHLGEETVALEPPTPAATPADHGETVLVIEDEPVVRNLIVDVLADLGYATLQASDGPSGLAIIEAGIPFDLLVTDIGLPGLNGRLVVETARRLRPKLRVLFMTGYAENAALAHGFLEPGMAMITKPFAMESLAVRVQEMLQTPG